MQTTARERSQVKPSQTLSASTGELTGPRWLPAHTWHRRDISCPLTHQHPGTAKPSKPSRVAQGDPAWSCTAACLGLFPSLLSSASPRQAASHPEPKHSRNSASTQQGMMISRQHSQGNTSWAGMRVIQKDTSHKPAAYIEAFPKRVSLSSSDSLSHAARWPRLLTGHTKNGLEYGGPAICTGCNFK